MASPKWVKALEVCCVIKTSLPNECGFIVEGECHRLDKVLLINKTISLERKLKALIHECLHLVYPKLTEREVRKREREEWEALTPANLRRLIDAMYPPRRPK